MAHTLVLNATYEPLGVVPDRRAIVLILARKALALEQRSEVARSATQAIPRPSVIKLSRFVRLPYRGGAIPLTRRALFARDGGRCAYCGEVATSVDHVVPRSRGGRHEWENVVAACHRCNRIKADRDVRELGWRLRHEPHRPAGAAWRVLASGRQESVWWPYLVGHGVDLAIRDLLAASA